MPKETRTTWRKAVKRLVADAEMARPASARALASIKTDLSQTAPLELRALLLEANGVTAADGVKLIWGIADIVSRNRAFRSREQFDGNLYGPFDSVLLFGEAGNGDLFGYDMGARATKRPPIIKWDHETDERDRVASGLEEYLRLRGSDSAGSRKPKRAARRSDAARDSRNVVSVWVGQHTSQAAFRAYLAAGGSGRVTADGLPLSQFQAEFNLSLQDVLQSEEHGVFFPRAQEITRLLHGVHGGHSFIAEAAKKAAALGDVRMTSAVLVYGLRRDAREAKEDPEPRGMTFLGSFEFE